MSAGNKISKKLFQMIDTLALINSTTDYDRLLQLIMKSIKEVMEAEASSLMLLDADTNELYFSKVEGGSDKVKEIRIRADQGIAGHVCQTGKPLIVNDVTQSKFFLKQVDKKTKFQTKSILCVPLIKEKKPIGVLQALNKKRPLKNGGDREFLSEGAPDLGRRTKFPGRTRIFQRPQNGGEFDKDDLKIFTAFSHQVAVALENARLYNLAVFDGLTKVHMRRYFEVWLAAEYSRVKRYKTNLALVMLDIDHFKNVNDTYGHQAGDYVLKNVAQTVKSAVRASDVMARYGGEEFIIGLPETKEKDAHVLAERIRKSVEKREFVFEGTKIPVTVSLGVSSFEKTPEETQDIFIKDADSALYRSKESGRNRVTLFRH